MDGANTLLRCLAPLCGAAMSSKWVDWQNAWSQTRTAYLLKYRGHQEWVCDNSKGGTFQTLHWPHCSPSCERRRSHHRTICQDQHIAKQFVYKIFLSRFHCLWLQMLLVVKKATKKKWTLTSMVVNRSGRSRLMLFQYIRPWPLAAATLRATAASSRWTLAIHADGD